MAEHSSNALQEAVINNFKSIDGVLKYFLALEGIICLLKFTKKVTFSLSGIDLPTKWAWGVFAFFTVAHLFTTWRFNQSTRKLLQSSTEKERQSAFEKVTSSGGPWVRNLIPRRRRNGKLYRMKWNDPSTPVSYLVAIFMIVAIVQFDFNRPRIIVAYLAVGTVIVVINWFIGWSWAVMLSQLAVKTDQAAESIADRKAPLSL